MVGTVHGDISDLEDDYISEAIEDGQLDCYINVDRRNQDISGNVQSIEGKIAAERITDEKTVEVENGNIQITPDRNPDWTWSNFWLVPDKFVVAENVVGDFPFDKLSQSADVDINRSRFNLTEIVQEHPGQWMGGFQDRPERVRSGTLYGEEIEEDIAMGDAFLNSDKNQIGPIVEFDGTEVKARITQDGLVQVVSPGSYTRDKYLTFIEEMLLDFTY